jgi:monoamine oxidase
VETLLLPSQLPRRLLQRFVCGHTAAAAAAAAAGSSSTCLVTAAQLLMDLVHPTGSPYALCRSVLCRQVILQFPRAFWTEETGRNQWFDLVPPGNPKVPNEFFSLHKATGQPILVVFYAGSPALVAEGMTDQQTLDQVMTTLREMFGSNIPGPTRHLITRWSQDKYSLGSYSFMKVGTARNARALLAQPEANKQVYFAGEATDDAFPGAVHGAWRSGQRAARQVIQVLKL